MGDLRCGLFVMLSYTGLKASWDYFLLLRITAQLNASILLYEGASWFLQFWFSAGCVLRFERVHPGT